MSSHPKNRQIKIRPFEDNDAGQVRDLFIKVNRLLAPPQQKEAFEGYITRSLAEEIDRISDYYARIEGGFWVAVNGETIVGMFGLEPSSSEAMELRRMYVDPQARRLGIAQKMLSFAEDECRRRDRPNMDLSTSELQGDALRFYQKCGYQLVREEIADTASNKTLGGGIRRFHFTKKL
ncbi:GNAT family N-acetyltransferase [Pseudohalocynthiibacter aestuariivivens]|jgi:GNAT superfamily N-acetyltransferase|uniref:GNAT family N-acetyltransferase n=1 Tax=Pseudohalocynthiibacter aestuariivivens TaxID=1591409 RepID=A0ABV5JC39_9RHOB|nr:MULTISPECIES: GNAT family N-acetyltransferase [Pseudohalocynthiibacter]MBS9718415.1 GNAT family N-acetyltransferase [Pseudohalocynthiibacter aestuariivivens]MCK0103424.1 GNAT family N-acetyltransferase [Pseudohalocynthiibacter sp. F2068]